MDISNQIKTRRRSAGFSQEQLAEKIYVSRQTISNWECDRSYPDVQSLLLLATLFGTSLDALVKGDVDTMDELLERDRLLKKKLFSASLGVSLLIVAYTALITGTPYTDAVIDALARPLSLAVLLVPPVILLIVDGAIMVKVLRILQDHDLVTYQEILAFDRGEPIERDSAVRARKAWLIKHRVAIALAGLLFAAAIGGVVGLLFYRSFG